MGVVVTTFVDALGRQWTIAGTYAGFARVKAETGVDLTDIASDGQESVKRLQDTFTLGGVLYCLVRDEAQARAIDEAGFFAGINGDTLHAAQKALIQEMIFFSPLHVRTTLQAIHDRMLELEAMTAAEMAAGPETIHAQVDAALAAWTRGRSASSSPASLASTQEPGASESAQRLRRAAEGNSGTTRPACSLSSASCTATRKNDRTRSRPRSSTR